jgi:hypothetical protein
MPSILKPTAHMPALQAITPWVAIYFVIVISLGSFMLLQLFLAVLLASLDKVGAPSVPPCALVSSPLHFCLLRCCACDWSLPAMNIGFGQVMTHNAPHTIPQYTQTSFTECNSQGVQNVRMQRGSLFCPRLSQLEHLSFLPR